MSKNAQIGGNSTFFEILRWIPIGAIGSNPWVNSRRMRNLNALFGVAYRGRQRFSIPQLGYFGYLSLGWKTKAYFGSVEI
jgi:hypothetical protein